MHHFRYSFLISLAGLGLAAWWGHGIAGTAGAIEAVGMATILCIMEISLSFDNAIVNASILKNWSQFWQNLFLTLGMFIAVFGMRLLFPLLIVAFAADMGLPDPAAGVRL